MHQIWLVIQIVIIQILKIVIKHILIMMVLPVSTVRNLSNFLILHLRNV